MPSTALRINFIDSEANKALELLDADLFTDPTLSEEERNRQRQEKRVLVLYHQLVTCPDKNKEAKNQLIKALKKSLPLTFLDKVRLQLNPFDLGAQQKILWARITHQDYYTPVHNYKTTLERKTLNKILRHYKNLKCSPRKNEWKLEQARHLTHQISNEKSLTSIKVDDPVLKAIVADHQKKITARSIHNYRRIRHTFLQFITSPYKTSFQAFLNIGGVDKETYEVLLILNYLGSQKFLTKIFLNYFKEINVGGKKAQVALDGFFGLLTSRFLLIRDFDMAPYGVDEKQKEENVLAQFARAINQLSNKFCFKGKAKKDTHNHYFIDETTRKTPKKLREKHLKDSTLWLGNILSLLVALGEGFIYYTSLAMLGLTPWVVLPISLASVYATYFFLVKENRGFIKDFLIKGKYFGNFTSFHGKLFVGLTGGILGASIGIVFGVLALGSVLYTPIIAAVAIPLSIILGVFTVIGFNCMMYMSLLHFFEDQKELYYKIENEGLLNYIKKSINDFIENWKALTNSARAELITSMIFKAFFVTLGLAFFALSMVATLGAWQKEFVYYSVEYFKISAKVANYISYGLIIGLANLGYSIFSAERFVLLFNGLAEVTVQRVIVPAASFVKALCTRPLELAKESVNGVRNTWNNVKKFVQKIPVDPWKTIFPLARFVKNILIDFPAVFFEAAGSAALSADGFESLRDIFHVNNKTAKTLSFFSEDVASVGINFIYVFNDENLPSVRMSASNPNDSLAKALVKKAEIKENYTAMGSERTPAKPTGDRSEETSATENSHRPKITLARTKRTDGMRRRRHGDGTTAVPMNVYHGTASDHAHSLIATTTNPKPPSQLATPRQDTQPSHYTAHLTPVKVRL